MIRRAEVAALPCSKSNTAAEGYFCDIGSHFFMVFDFQTFLKWTFWYHVEILYIGNQVNIFDFVFVKFQLSNTIKRRLLVRHEILSERFEIKQNSEFRSIHKEIFIVINILIEI